jgi:hypothetical protein
MSPQEPLKQLDRPELPPMPLSQDPPVSQALPPHLPTDQPE